MALEPILFSLAGGCLIGLSMLIQLALRDGLASLRNKPRHRAIFLGGLLLRLFAVCGSFALLVLVVHFISPRNDPSVVNVAVMVIGLIAALRLGRPAAKWAALMIQRTLRRPVKT